MNKLILVITLFFMPCLVFSQTGDTNTTASSLKYIIVKNGNGTKAVNGKSVEVNYVGTLTDGTEFDNSYKRKEAFDFTLGNGEVIKGWDEGIALMRVGDKMRLIIPPDLGYGSRGGGNIIPPNATLIFDVELIKVQKSIIDAMMTVISKKSVQDAIDFYNDLKDDHPDEYNFKESQLNILGYELLQSGREKEAIEIFKLNVEQFPDSYNVYDSLGEGYMNNGDTKLAIKNYKKSLELNPNNDNAKKMLDQINQK